VLSARIPVTGTLWTVRVVGFDVARNFAGAAVCSELPWRAAPVTDRIDLSHQPNKNGTGNEPDAVSVDSARCNAMPPIDLNVLQRAVSFPR
jgi:hypothetical protein